jgi:hypothetical protein
MKLPPCFYDLSNLESAVGDFNHYKAILPKEERGTDYAATIPHELKILDPSSLV